MPTKEFHSTAYHEAAHAVTAWYGGNSVGDMSIESDGYNAGEAKHGDCDAEADIGVTFYKNPQQGLIVEVAPDEYRLPTKYELEHYDLTVVMDELEPVDRFCMLCAAGEAAQMIVAPELFHPVHSSGDREDAGMWHVEPRELTDSEWQDYVNQTKDFLTKPPVWQRVKALAENLLEHKTLSGDKVYEIIKGRIKPHPEG